MPTRGRAELALRSARQVQATAADPFSFEFIIACDDDDGEQRDALERGLRDSQIPFSLATTPRLGYANLHIYNNILASHASGQWLCIWNDDVLMQTQDWDVVLREHASKFVVVDPEISNANAEQFRFGLFPMVPRAWFQVLGHLSASAHNDTYILLLADALGLRWPGLLTVYHDRFDESGRNDDETYRARAYGTDDFYNDPPLLARMNLDARRLGRAIRRQPGLLMRVNLRDDPTRPPRHKFGVRTPA